MEGAAPSRRNGRASPPRTSTSGGVSGWALLIVAAIGVYAWRKYEANKTRPTTATNGAVRVGVPAASDAEANVAVIHRGRGSASHRESGRAEAHIRSGFAGRQLAFAALLGLVVLFAVPAASARHLSRSPAGPQTLWAVDVTPWQAANLTSATIASWRAKGINSIVLETKLVGKAAAARVAALAVRGKLTVIALDGKHGACHVALAGSACAMTATSALQALSLARTHGRDSVIAVHLSGPNSVRFLRTLTTTGARVLAIPPLSMHPSFTGTAWETAIAIAATTPTLGLAVHVQTSTPSSQLTRFLALLSSTSSVPAGISAVTTGLPAPTRTAPRTSPPLLAPAPSPGSSGSSGSASLTVPSVSLCYAGRSVSLKFKAVFAAAACAVGAGVAVTSSGPPGGSGTSTGGVTTTANGANIWVSTSGSDGTCTRSGSPIPDPGGGNDCATFDGAAMKASAGDVIGVACGTYTGQSITVSPGVPPAITFDGNNFA